MLLSTQLQKEREFSPLIRALKTEYKPVLVTGISSSLQELFPAALMGATGEKILAVFPKETDAASFAKSMTQIYPRSYFFPARDWSLVRVDSSSRDFAAQRLKVLCHVQSGEFDLVATTVEALCQATLPPEVLSFHRRKISVGDTVSKEELISCLTEAGYRYGEKVEGPGQYAARGDIVDVFLLGEEAPLRVELFGDEVDAIGSFDPITQRRVENLSSFFLSPAEELIFTQRDRETISRYLSESAKESRPEEKEKRVFIRDLADRIQNGMDFPGDLFLPLIYRFGTLLDYFPREWILFFQPSQALEQLSASLRLLTEEMKLLWEENKTLLPPREIRLLETPEELCARLQEKGVILMENFFGGKSPVTPNGIFRFQSRTVSATFRDLSVLREDLTRYGEEGYRTAVLCENSLAAQTLEQSLKEAGTEAHFLRGDEEEFPSSGVGILSRSTPWGSLVKNGFELGSARFALITDAAPAFKAKAPRKKVSPVKAEAKEKLISYTDLAVGDYVVHSGHGIGVFRGVEKMKSAEGNLKDFIKIAYAGSDILYVPCSNLDSVSKYIGPKSDSATLKLNRLGGSDWQKARARAKGAAKDIAKKLIALYADRQRSRGFAFSPDSNWQKEFEDAFPYGETEGQLRATEEIKADMEKEIPMDRLLCGDVGFGKTEVALRGVFKCVMDNKQAAILVPTTILAWQHYQTLLSRFKGYPVRIEMISRFRTKKEQKKILEKLKLGEVDILVGTHRLIQDDVSFADLGFLVIDEEQRFGVSHKEKLKELSRGVDVLTLTATPIPRTLNMALGGIKDMSLLEEAPEDRFPVQTYVMEYDFPLLEEAIRRELRREGQVFYLNNNIAELETLLPRLARSFPEASIALAHGKMDKESLSEIWKEMMDHRVDILLCTTIIETGVDLPDANTLIVENADHFGLSQLHQIRGRVGRSDRKAYAYFTYQRGKVLTEVSVKRLEAIREYTRFGCGFQIAMRDLEIRGAGNLLGAEQSGHLDSVGYDMYMKILSEAVLEAKGEAPAPKAECTVDLALDGYIPESYVPYPAQRMDLYRKIASMRTEEDASDLTDELLDRYGDVPKTVQNLFSVALLRALAEELQCEKISQRSGKLIFSFQSAREEALALLCAVYASRLTLSLADKPEVLLRLSGKETPLTQCRELLEHYRGFLDTLHPKENKEKEE